MDGATNCLDGSVSCRVKKLFEPLSLLEQGTNHTANVRFPLPETNIIKHDGPRAVTVTNLNLQVTHHQHGTTQCTHAASLDVSYHRFVIKGMHMLQATMAACR
jgi:hypothetical protein